MAESRDGTRRGRYARLRLSMGRHPADLARVVVAAAVVLWATYAAVAPQINPVETAILQDIQQLPGWSKPLWRLLTLVGWWPGIAVCAAVTLYAGRVRLAVSMVVSGVAAGAVALVLQALTSRRDLTGADLFSLAHAPAGFNFPSQHVAVAAALATAAGPYLVRRARNACWVVVVLVAAGDVFLAQHLPLGVFAGAFIGWGCGALFHIALAAPGRATTEAAVRHVLTRAGLTVDDITRVRSHIWHPQVFEVATCDHERLAMTVVRRMHRRAGPAYKLRRLLASLEVEDEPALSTPRHEVEHEAYVTLLAERAGVRTLPIVLAGELDHGAPFLLRRWVDGRRLSTMSSAEVDDELLDAVWRSVRTLSSVSITHHDLRAANFLVDADGQPHVTSFTFSRVGGRSGQGSQDFADVLVSIASVVGTRRALDSATRALDRGELEGMLPCLQGLALHRHLRGQLSNKAALAELRESLADRLDTDVPSLRSPVRPATLAMLLTGGIAVYLLLPELSSMQQVLQSLSHANWWWVAVTIVVAMLSVIVSAWTMFGASTTPLPVWRTVGVQIAAAFTGRTTVGGVGFFAVNIVFLEKLGLRRAKAVGVVLLSRIGHGMISAITTIVGLLAIGRAVPVGEFHMPSGRVTWLVVILLGCVVIAIVLSPFGRAHVVHPLGRMVRDILRDLGPALRAPVRAAELFGASFVSLALSALGLVTTLEAFHPGAPILPVMAVFIVASTLGQLAPTPGGLGAVEAAMVAGLTAIGIDSTDAVAAVLACRLLTFWLPVVPGVAAFRILQRRHVI